MSKRKGFTMSDLERMKASNLAREELQKLVSAAKPYLPTGPTTFVGATPPTNARNGDMWMDNSLPITGALWNAMERQDPIRDTSRWTVQGNTLPPGLTMSRSGMISVAIQDYGNPNRMPAPKPEPPQPTGRFRNLDFE